MASTTLAVDWLLSKPSSFVEPLDDRRTRQVACVHGFQSPRHQILSLNLNSFSAFVAVATPPPPLRYAARLSVPTVRQTPGVGGHQAAMAAIPATLSMRTSTAAVTCCSAKGPRSSLNSSRLGRLTRLPTAHPPARSAL